ncbi:MAG: division/cell wall cluster transcriptional repressor MraZ [Clostridiales bacterium]|nr:division/cell wall cluster transcriptional repressor MraZ [Candidatus Crickella caballi]
MLFTGSYQNSIDSKNRLIIPAKYRDLLGGQCMLVKGFDCCLYIYAMEDWEVLVNKIAVFKQTDRDNRTFIRKFFSSAVKCDLDAQGRILIPQQLKDYAHINKELVTLGAMDKIEIWAAEVMNDEDNDNMMDDEEFVKKLEIYDL